ncbi:type II toxin-antitoxin system HipA family toxin [Schumannella sp. 10F1B-5-1]|uniref:type II toxin-antitoxin system HipA family toxin n=1 Tax=Schumannella sp. 10F1B-5-1 TaxID=2590780 RepID=UPI0011305C8B|nr:type II toxin-antitoxin system HipA family toxin [Schumannella sp. 10F1B-5-1]TPW78291.1 type II toxin-antitoxin system HipA family toxin [Schumannella sp. 10F1B-5-1]
MSPVDRLEVHIELTSGLTMAGVAQFHRRRGPLDSTTFQYSGDYLARPDAYAIDPALPLVSGTQHSGGLPGAFSDAAPDRWGRTLIQKRERAAALEEGRAPRALDDVDFLLGVSDSTRQGALRFRESPTGSFLDPRSSIPRLISLPTLLRAADAADGDASGFAAVKVLLDAGTGSLGGARPKASVVDADGRQLIAKFPHHSDAWDVMGWEATALDLASRCGIDVPDHRLTQVDGRGVLLVTRFDRAPDGDGTARIGYASAMTQLELRDGEPADYVDLAETLTTVGSRARSDAVQLFRRAAFGVAINNTDDHARNHGFLREPGGWRLSPAFDLNPNPLAAARQTTIGGSATADDAAAGLRELARACRLTPSGATEIASDCADATAGWREVATSNGIPTSGFERFAESLRRGIEAVRSV